MKKKAQQVKVIKEFNGYAALYRLSEPMQGYIPRLGERSFDYVVVSSIPFCEYGVAETCIFGSDSDGNVVSWSELDGSYSSGTSHSAALAMAGYDVEVLA